MGKKWKLEDTWLIDRLFKYRQSKELDVEGWKLIIILDKMRRFNTLPLSVWNDNLSIQITLIRLVG